MKKVIIFGATGKAGRCLVNTGIDCGYQITAFVRNKTKLLALLGAKAHRLNIIEGDALDEMAVAKAVCGKTAYLS